MKIEELCSHEFIRMRDTLMAVTRTIEQSHHLVIPTFVDPQTKESLIDITSRASKEVLKQLQSQCYHPIVASYDVGSEFTINMCQLCVCCLANKSQIIHYIRAEEEIGNKMKRKYIEWHPDRNLLYRPLREVMLELAKYPTLP